MKKYSVHDSLGETIGYIQTTCKDRSIILQQAQNLFAFDKPTIKLIKTK